ncbi:putative transcriptional regulator of ribosomal protein biogenesis [Entomophthora muscae]|uniref:Transcriptional regulator of ribosomal protein biogenesis n=1 Tax=Entomophthora muscae TaxID=34485 RepID=A0ACC2SNA5_9FUNG|nr:putative transcriptional regulator of ribosomal protein biogenesis [Entomophthora muscae]
MEIHTRDLQHQQELLAFYYPDVPEYVCRLERPLSPDAPICLYERGFGFYVCCSKVYGTPAKALEHWLELHFIPFKSNMNVITPHGLIPSLYYRPNPCKSSANLTNTDISLVARAEYFLSNMKSIPVTPSRFCPAPHTKPPHEFKNPLAATLAMAYDFIETVLAGSKEYLLLILDSADVTFGCEVSNHLIYFPFWANYSYPSQPKVIATALPSGPYPVKLSRNCEGLYACPTPGCQKRYKQPNGLKYHVNIGQCIVIDIENGEHPSTEIHMFVNCPFLPCSSSF